MTKFIPLLILPILLISCTKVYNSPSSPTSSSTTNTTKKDTVEFRVTGNATLVKIRYNNALDGLVQLNTTLPYVFSFQNSKDFIFLSLEVTPLGYSSLTNSPFLSAQIYVNGNLFREATSSDFLFDTLTVSGSFRR